MVSIQIILRMYLVGGFKIGNDGKIIQKAT